MWPFLRLVVFLLALGLAARLHAFEGLLELVRLVALGAGMQARQVDALLSPQHWFSLGHVMDALDVLPAPLGTVVRLGCAVTLIGLLLVGCISVVLRLVGWLRDQAS